ncbi:MAG: alcohol dehydrogenase catalytic domain-containing protein [Proteobacteria bacterium]|nr:alcohol dehydrogenase catalytic domain-containing protein [Pseudomonadota bacterium]
MADKMMACVRKDPGVLVLEERDIPTIETPEDVILKVRFCAICGTDNHAAELAFPDVVMGHEVVGEIVDIGSGVEDFQTGDRVVASCMLSCGRCANCQQGEPSACLNPEGRVQHGIVLDGCQAEYVRIPFAPFSICRIPDALNDQQAIVAGDIFSTAVGVLERASLSVGDSVAIFAQGPLGLCVTAAARAMGAGLVIAVDPDPFKRETAKKLGATLVLDPGKTDVVHEILNLTDGFGVNIAVEAVGKQETLQGAFGVARIGGAISSLGVYGFDFNDLAIPVAHDSLVPDTFYHRSFITTLCPSGRYRMQRLMDLIQYGNIDLSPIWTHTMPLTKIVDAYEMMKNPKNKIIKMGILPE